MTKLAWLFLRQGATACGGPAAHIALMEEEVVRCRKCLSPQRFLNLLSDANLVPGPNSGLGRCFIPRVGIP
ncbi:chromate transporter [Solirubrum puertoriconensis]|uniref:chromate transporter n=1 Tax=Solirubrum puertoriconensis TaxID=1751427 RepID=UPI001C1F23B2